MSAASAEAAQNPGGLCTLPACAAGASSTVIRTASVRALLLSSLSVLEILTVFESLITEEWLRYSKKEARCEVCKTSYGFESVSAMS
jgi:hypothetical protein